METYKYIFIVLVYKNLDVLDGFYKSFEEVDSSYKIIIVDSFFSDEVRQKCKAIALEHNSDFIPIENKGYGYGNNVGIEYAMNHYDYDFLVISNSDILISNMGDLEKYTTDSCIIAPEISLISGKKQNPHLAHYSRLYYFFLKMGYRYNQNKIVWCGFLVSRLIRELFRIFSTLVKRNCYRIFSAHGAFIIFTKYSVKQLAPVFNNEMFLYNEELFLGLKAKQSNVPVIYDKTVKVLHLEGASAGNNYDSIRSEYTSYNRLFPLYRDSFLVLDKWKNGN